MRITFSNDEGEVFSYLEFKDEEIIKIYEGTKVYGDIRVQVADMFNATREWIKANIEKRNELIGEE